MRRAAPPSLRTAGVRRDILDAATRRFAADGFDGVALQDIADDVALRKASLLYHFPSKDRLREAVIGELLDHWSNALPHLLGSAVSGARRLDAVMQEALAFFSAAPYRARLLLREMLDHPAYIRTRLAKQLGPWLLMLADFIRRGQREGIIHRDLDPEAYVFHVIHLVLSGVAVAQVTTGLYSQRASRARTLERHHKELVRLAKAGLFSTYPEAEHG